MADLTLQAGSALITPSRPGELGGYIARAGALSAGTHDELEAALIVLGDGTRRVAWLTLDAIGVTGELDALLRPAVLDAIGGVATLVIAASHSHSAPLGWTGGIHPGNPGARSEPARDELVGRVAALAAEVAASTPVPVRAEWDAVAVPGVGANRLRPDGPHDDRVGVLALREGESLRAVLFDFATHPTVLGPANLRWSADWPGAARAVVRAALDAAGAFGGTSRPPVIGFLQGAAGDVSSRFTRRGDGFDEAARLGTLVAAAVLGVLERGGRVLDPRLQSATGSVVLDRRALPDPVDAEQAVADAATALSALAGSPLDPAVRIAQTRHDGARVQRDLAAAGLDPRLVLPLTAIAVGDVAWAHVPLELFASLGLRIAERSPFAATRVIGYSNGYSGYLADEHAHASGSYEALSSFFPAEAGAPLVEAMDTLLTTLTPEFA